MHIITLNKIFNFLLDWFYNLIINTLSNITKYNLYTENSIERYNILMYVYNHNCSDKILLIKIYFD